MSVSLWQILVVVVLVFLLFGRGRVSALMEDFGKGIKSFKRGLSDDDKQASIEDKNKDSQP